MQNLIPFQPALWAANPHSQTILGDLAPSPPLKTQGRDFIVACEDGDQLKCHFHEGPSSTILAIGHGLTGSADAGYTQRITQIFLNEGHSVLRINHRNCGQSFGLARNPYHAGRSDDFARIVFELRKHFPNKKIVLLGFSMSGNASLLLASGTIPAHRIFSQNEFDSMAEKNKWSQPDFVIAVNPPVDLSRTTDRFLEGKMNLLYQWNFVRYFHKLMQDLQAKNLLDQKYKTHPLMTIRQFDDQYTSIRAGFKNAEDYYQNCSSKTKLSEISIPTYILTSKDDPLISMADYLNSGKSEFLKMQVEKHGGHMGYLSKQKTPLGNFRWLDYAILEIYKEMTRSII